MVARAKIRFVGGPWHNRVALVDLLPTIAIPEPTPAVVCAGRGYAPRSETKSHFYVLRTFRGHEEDADGEPVLVFQQYLHTSLAHEPPAWSFEEVGFPPLPDSYFAEFFSNLLDAHVSMELSNAARLR